MLNATVESEMSTRIEFKDGGCRHIEFRKDVAISLLLNHLILTKHGVNIKYMPAGRKTANINVKNYINLIRGVYRPDNTYKTAKMIYQNIHTKLEWIVVVSNGKKTRWPIYQRLIDVCIAICNHLIERSN